MPLDVPLIRSPVVFAPVPTAVPRMLMRLLFELSMTIAASALLVPSAIPPAAIVTVLLFDPLESRSIPL